MKTRFIALLTTLFLTVSMSAYGKEVNQNVDVLDKMLEMNSDKYGKPSATYRKGHASQIKIPKNLVSRKKNGFRINLPGSYPIATPSVYKDRLFVSGGFGSKEFYSFNSKTGKPIWGINLDDDGPSSAVIEDNIVVFNTESCTVFAVDGDSGEMLWSWWLGDPLTSTPSISKGRVFTTYPANGQGHQNKKLLLNSAAIKMPSNKAPSKHKEASHILGSFDLKTGKILWQKWIDGDAISAPTIVDGEVFITTFPGTIYKFKATDGTILSAIKARATSAPTIVDKEIYYTNRSDTRKGEVKESIVVGEKNKLKTKSSFAEKQAVYLDKKVQQKSSLEKKSKQLDSGNGFGSAPIASGYNKAASNIGQSRVSSMQSFQGSKILNYQDKNFNSMGDEIICTDPKDGKTVWKKKIKGNMRKQGGFLATPPIGINGKIIVATLKGEIILMDAKSGNTIKKYDLKTTIRFQPTVVDGRIYVGTQDGQVICIDTKDKSLTGWTMWGGNAAHTGVAGSKL